MLRVTFVLVLSSTIAVADEKPQFAEQTRWDCSTDRRAEIQSGHGSWVIEGACKRIHVGGDANQITIARVTTLDVDGSNNQIKVTAVDEIVVAGSGNRITYGAGITSAAPKLKIVGSRNQIAAHQPPVKPRVPDKSSGEAASKAVTYDCRKTPNVTISHNGGADRLIGSCEKVVLDGTSDTVTIETARQLVINGAHNHVEVVAVETITLVGADNRVTYGKGISSKTPKVVSVGKGNQVGRVK